MVIGTILQRFRRGLSCDDVLNVLQSYLDGEVDAETARRVAGHLEDCLDCDLESDVYLRIKATLASTAEPVDPTVMANLRGFSARLVAGELD